MGELSVQVAPSGAPDGGQAVADWPRLVQHAEVQPTAGAPPRDAEAPPDAARTEQPKQTHAASLCGENARALVQAVDAAQPCTSPAAVSQASKDLVKQPTTITPQIASFAGHCQLQSPIQLPSNAREATASRTMPKASMHGSIKEHKGAGACHAPDPTRCSVTAHA